MLRMARLSCCNVTKLCKILIVFITIHLIIILTAFVIKEWDLFGPNEVTILLWTTRYNRSMGQFEEDNAANLNYDGKQASCVFTTNRSLLEQSNVVVFHCAHTDFKNMQMPVVSRKVRKKQIWVLWAWESPVFFTSHHLSKLDNTFNWTMAYRRDADLWYPYGKTIHVKNPVADSEDIKIQNTSLSTWVSEKNSFVAWVVSHCNRTKSRRERLVNQLLAAGLKIDTFGECGASICPFWEMEECDSNPFFETLGKNYKFYLALENALCEDYITEKLWRTYNLGMVPIVYGGANYSQLAPPGSYIDVRDFKTAKMLIEYLHYLDGNDTAYKKYFEWRQNYQILEHDFKNPSIASLCIKAYDFFRNKSSVANRVQKVYEDIKNWWFYSAGGDQPACSEIPYSFE